MVVPQPAILYIINCFDFDIYLNLQILQGP